MSGKFWIYFGLIAAPLFAQRVTGSQTADIRGGGGSEGKCTIEAWVDDVADVEIRGTRAVIRTFAGSPASLRRFQCNEAMPSNPRDFRFKGVDGRGRQSLVRQPSRGAAVVRIEDSKSGGEGDTFDIFWSGGGGYSDGGYGDGPAAAGTGTRLGPRLRVEPRQFQLFRRRPWFVSRPERKSGRNSRHPGQRQLVGICFDIDGYQSRTQVPERARREP